MNPRLAEIEARKVEIRAELEKKDPKTDLDKLETELRSLNAEKAQIEKREQIIKGLNEGKLEGRQLPNPLDPKSKEKREFENMPREDLLKTEEYRGAFFKSLLGKTMTDNEKRAFEAANSSAEKRSYDSSTTAVIPTATSDILFQKMVKVAPLINEITLLRVAGNVKFAVQGTRDDAALHTENAAITPAGDTLVYVELGGYDITKIIRISKTIQTMAISAFEGWLTDMLATDIAVKIEDFTINGTGSSQPNGVEKAVTWIVGTNNVQFTKGGSPIYDNVVDLISYLPARYTGNAKFLCNNKFLYGMLAKIKDDNKRPILVQDFSNPIAQRVLGFPVLISDKVADKTLYFGDFKQMVGNLAQDVTVEMSTASGFLNRSIDFLGSALYDCDVALTDAFCKLSEAAGA
jgi:HK97 family phage major capsid protein